MYRVQSHGVPLDLDVYLPVPRVYKVVLLVDSPVVHDIHQVYVHVPQRFLKEIPQRQKEGRFQNFSVGMR